MAWALLSNSRKVIGSRYCDRGVNLHTVHEERTVACDDDRAAGTRERHSDARSEAVSHAAHAEGDKKAAVPTGRQVVDGRGADVACIDDDIGAGGQRRVEHCHGVAVPDTRTVMWWRP